MSLVSQLKSTTSPVHIYFKENYPGLQKYLKNDVDAISKCDTLVPSVKENYPWSSVGHMAEYLFQIHMGVPVKDLYPMRFLAKANSVPAAQIYNKTIKAFYYKIDSFIPRFIEQCDCLYSLALFEANIRQGAKFPVKLTNAPREVVEDMVNLWECSLSAHNYYNPLDKIIYNPEFSLSPLIGGADADFIKVNADKKYGNTLVDMKVTIRDEVPSVWIYQMLGYIFLDKLNYYKLKNIEIFLPRKNAMMRWTVEELIVNSSNYSSVRKAKSGFMDALKQLPASRVMATFLNQTDVPEFDLYDEDLV